MSESPNPPDQSPKSGRVSSERYALDVPPGNYLVTLLPGGGHRLWNARAVDCCIKDQEGVTSAFTHLNIMVDQEIREALAEMDDEDV